MSRLAQQKNAINLGQGFPEGCEPREIIERAAWALLNESNTVSADVRHPLLFARLWRRTTGSSTGWT